MTLRVYVTNSWIFGVQEIVIVVQVLGKYLIEYLDLRVHCIITVSVSFSN